MAKIIKRYQNRKLYDTEMSTYVTLDDITRMIRDGEDVKVIDNKTKRDLTSVTLAQIIFEEQKKQEEILPLATLKRIIQTRGESITDFFEKKIAPGVAAVQQAQRELEQKVEALIALGKTPAEEAAGVIRDFLSSSQQRIDEFQRSIDERVRLVLDRVRPAAALQREIVELEAKIAELERLLAAERKKNARPAPRGRRSRAASSV